MNTMVKRKLSDSLPGTILKFTVVYAALLLCVVGAALAGVRVPNANFIALVVAMLLSVQGFVRTHGRGFVSKERWAMIATALAFDAALMAVTMYAFAAGPGSVAQVGLPFSLFAGLFALRGLLDVGCVYVAEYISVKTMKASLDTSRVAPPTGQGIEPDMGRISSGPVLDAVLGARDDYRLREALAARGVATTEELTDGHRACMVALEIEPLAVAIENLTIGTELSAIVPGSTLVVQSVNNRFAVPADNGYRDLKATLRDTSDGTPWTVRFVSDSLQAVQDDILPLFWQAASIWLPRFVAERVGTRPFLAVADNFHAFDTEYLSVVVGFETTEQVRSYASERRRHLVSVLRDAGVIMAPHSWTLFGEEYAAGDADGRTLEGLSFEPAVDGPPTLDTSSEPAWWRMHHDLRVRTLTVPAILSRADAWCESPANEPDVFGCGQCWPAEAEAAWEARKRLTLETTLIDESHFSVSILACPECHQRFLSVFTEQIDWKDGDDPQCFSSLPLRDDEAVSLASDETGFSEARLGQLAPERRSLRHDWPKGVSAAATSWGCGVPVGPHD